MEKKRIRPYIDTLNSAFSRKEVKKKTILVKKIEVFRIKGVRNRVTY